MLVGLLPSHEMRNFVVYGQFTASQGFEHINGYEDLLLHVFAIP